MLMEHSYEKRVEIIDLEMSPQVLRACFIALTFNGCANLMVVQDVEQRKDSLTIEQYQ